MKTWHLKALRLRKNGAIFRRSATKPDVGYLALASQIIAIVAVVFAGLTWWDARENGKIATAQTVAAEQLARAADRQAQLASQQLEANRALGRAAEKQADVAGQQITVSRRSLDLQAASGVISRAFLQQAQMDARSKGRTIQIAFVNIPATLVENGAATFSQVINNIGNAPIDIDDYYTGVELGEERPEAFFQKYLQNIKSITPRRRTIGPGMSLAPSFDMGLRFTKEMVAAFDAKKTRLVFMSYVPYRDASGIQHHAYSCVFVEKGAPSQACQTPLDD